MIDRLNHMMNAQQRALGIRATRQEMLASNIANADTPHYKARDIDFKAALGAAMGGNNVNTPGAAGMAGSLPLNQTAFGHQAGNKTDGAFDAAVRYRSEYQSAVDGNTVNMDIERAAFAENALRIEAALTFVRGQFNTIQMAVQGQ
ncbi:MAG: flagellar basal body rod protein FlgB [Rhodocyclaceae bacterium]|nr:flagellar basal body rod protein FlgB [Rhodocyclaceae bacterium]